MLPKAFVDENFDFYGKTLTGAQELRARWKRCVRRVGSDLGEALASLMWRRIFLLMPSSACCRWCAPSNRRCTKISKACRG